MVAALARFGFCVGSLTVIAALLLVREGLAQANPDQELLDQARRMERVQAQKREADLRQALRDAERLARTDRARAVERLQKALAELEDDTALPPQRREAVKRMLRDRIRVLQAGPDEPTGRPAPADKQAPLSLRRAEEKARADLEKTRQGMQTIGQLQGEGKTAAANRAAGELARQRPQDPTAQALEQTTRSLDQATQARRLQNERQRQLAAGYRDIDQSATPGSGDLEFPKDWKERTKDRSAAVPMTAKERAIVQALNTTISVNFRNSKLEDVIEFLQTYMGQPILLDREGLKDAEVSYDTVLTLNVQGVTVRTVLRKILADLGLTYVVKDETIQITSTQKARDMMVVRRYYIGDLLAGMSTLGTPGAPLAGLGAPAILPGGLINRGPGPFNAIGTPQLQAMQNMEGVKHLIELIQSSVEPSTWQVNGGSGTVVFHAATLSLVIKQSAEVHALLGGGGLLR